MDFVLWAVDEDEADGIVTDGGALNVAVMLPNTLTVCDIVNAAVFDVDVVADCSRVG